MPAAEVVHPDEGIAQRRASLGQFVEQCGGVGDVPAQRVGEGEIGEDLRGGGRRGEQPRDDDPGVEQLGARQGPSRFEALKK